MLYILSLSLSLSLTHTHTHNCFKQSSHTFSHIYSLIKTHKPLITQKKSVTVIECRSQWPRALRSSSAVSRLLRLWVRIPPGAWMSVSCEFCVLSSRGLCDELITRPEESYRLWCVVVCDLETSWMRRPWPTGGCRAKNKQRVKGRTWVSGADNVQALLCIYSKCSIVALAIILAQGRQTRD